ncbi:hypothetical protein ACQY0O_000661 [Thecaphora frezii]
MAAVPSFKLNTGASIPAIGMGCWMGQPGAGLDKEILSSLGEALEAGYRHIDTASFYQNEREVGQVIRDSRVPREEIFLTTKLSPHHYHDVVAGFEASLRDLGLDYVDLYLMHWPMGIRASDGRAYGDREGDIGPTFNQVWAEMEKLLDTHRGKVRAIGVSNFSPKNLNKLLSTAKVVPAVNQIENHPYLPDEELVELCKQKGILVTAYSPLGQSNSPILTDPDLRAIGKAHGATNATVAISWLVQRGIAAIPKSANKERMRQNLKLLTLSEDEMERIYNISRLDPSRHSRLITIGKKEGVVLGWTLDQLGFDVGYHLQPSSSKDAAKASDQGLPSAIREFVDRFYRISDTAEAHQEYVEQFIDDGERLSFQIGPMEVVNQPEGILEWRRKGWTNVTRRKHEVKAIFVSPEKANAIMLDGTVEMDREGQTLRFNWAGRMVFDPQSVDEGKPKIESYKVWLSQV